MIFYRNKRGMSVHENNTIFLCRILKLTNTWRKRCHFAMINDENTTSYIDIEQLENSLKFYLSTPLSIQEKIMISYSKSRHAQKLEELSFFSGF